MSTFQDRQRDLFNQLSEAEKQCNKHSVKAPPIVFEQRDRVDRRTARKVRVEMKQFRGKESIFKRPEAPLGHCLRTRSIPSFKKNPSNWVHYSLEDVKDEQMSDRANTATALAFIRELEERNQQSETNMVVDNADLNQEPFKKPVFKHSATIRVREEPTATQDITFRSSKILMPEYVVGVKDKTTKKEKTKPVGEQPKTSLKLNHLFEDEFSD